MKKKRAFEFTAEALHCISQHSRRQARITTFHLSQLKLFYNFAFALGGAWSSAATRISLCTSTPDTTVPPEFHFFSSKLQCTFLYKWSMEKTSRCQPWCTADVSGIRTISEGHDVHSFFSSRINPAAQCLTCLTRGPIMHVSWGYRTYRRPRRW